MSGAPVGGMVVSISDLSWRPSERPVKVFVTLYLLGMAVLILRRIISGGVEDQYVKGTVPTGVVGEFLDAIGGGS